MQYSEIRKTLRDALDEIHALTGSRHAGLLSLDVNEQMELLLQIKHVAETAVGKVSEV